MPSLPRVITVDSSWTIARVVRAAVDLLDMTVIQVDVPGGSEALDEIKRGSANLVVTAWELYNDIQGLELALRIKQTSPDTAVIILADQEDPEELDAETLAESPFVYMHRPVDIHKFLRVLVAGMRGEDIFQASQAPVQAAAAPDHGPVPTIDVNNVRAIVDRLLADVGAMAIILADRAGETILERGAVGYLNREQLTNALRPMMTTTIEMGDLVGGQAQSLQFYDGEDKDVFVFSVGLHHFMCVIFDGQAGSRQFGLVNRYGRQAVQDMIALLGASAFMIGRVAQVEAAPQPDKKSARKAKAQPAVEEEPLERMLERPPAQPPAPEPLRLDPIMQFDASILDSLGELDTSQADDLFDPDKLADLVNKGSGRKEVSFKEAIELGVLGDIEGGGSS
ncbi:MAG: response regulator [Chloroflexi bacterium]|nr:response regulator [Chloroflexota bacterium]